MPPWTEASLFTGQIIGQGELTRRAATFSNSSTSAVHEKRYDCSDQKYDEQYLCNPRRSGGNATETKQSGY
jgi:hypothetical protein